MPKVHFQTIAEQVAEFLEQELLKRRWTGLMPGKNELAGELGVNNKTVEVALRQLENKGVLINQGAGKRRKIKSMRGNKNTTSLRVALFLLDEMDRSDYYMIELQHAIEEAGHVPFFPDQTSNSFGESTTQLSRYVKKTEADAWIIVAGSRPVLEWFAGQDVPAFALFGRRRNVSIASTGPEKLSAMSTATERLLDLGHRRISLLCREQRRVPSPGDSERTFLASLEKAGISTSRFNLPDWEENREGFMSMLDSLFGTTPPTALIVDEAFLFNASFYYLAHRGLRVPQDVSLVCTDSDPHFAWCRPSVAHIRWHYPDVIRHTIRWLKNVASGKDHRRQMWTKAEFIEAETIGPARS
ncbi:MAG: substrate-binding domain-containing protein [Akkermansiaceae bacterium]